MARAPLIKQSNLADFSATEGKLVKAAICAVNPDLTINKSPQEAAFKINPSSWEDNKTSNWVPNIIPGQSDPIYQWISGGARTLSFEALVTKDSSNRLNKTANPIGQLETSALNAVGSLASNFFGVSLPPLAGLLANTSQQSTNPLDISSYLDYYRSFLYATYDPTTNKVLQSPPLIALFMANSLSTGYSPLSDEIHAGTIIWIMTNLGIRITKQLPSLCPMEAMVSFQFAQYTTATVDRSNVYSAPSSPVPNIPGAALFT